MRPIMLEPMPCGPTDPIQAGAQLAGKIAKGEYSKNNIGNLLPSGSRLVRQMLVPSSSWRRKIRIRLSTTGL